MLCRGRARSQFPALVRTSSRYCSSQGDPDFGAGLFGFAELARGPSGFNALVSRVGERVNALRARVLDADARGEHGLPVLCTMDAISDEVCTVIDAAELCRNVHHCAVHRDAANNCVLRISSLIHELNTDVALHQTLCRSDAFMRNGACDTANGTFTAEQLRMAKLLLEDFERDGIHLSARGRARVRELQSLIDELGARFTRGIGDPTCTRSVAISAAELASLPPGVRPRLRPNSADVRGGGGGGDGTFEDGIAAAAVAHGWQRTSPRRNTCCDTVRLRHFGAKCFWPAPRALRRTWRSWMPWWQHATTWHSSLALGRTRTLPPRTGRWREAWKTSSASCAPY